MNKEKLVVLAQAAEKENDQAVGIPISEILKHDPQWQREIGNLVINVNLLKAKCKEGLIMTQNIINHPNYNKHDFKLSRFVNMWQHVIRSIQDYERRLDKYFAPVKSTEFTTMSATYERRLRKLLKDVEEKIEEISTSASNLQDISDQVSLGENFHFNYGTLNNFKNEVKEFIRVLKDKDFKALEETVSLKSVKANKLVSAQFSTQVPIENQFDVGTATDEERARSENLMAEMSQIVQNMTSIIQGISAIEEGQFRGFFNAVALEDLQEYIKNTNLGIDQSVIAALNNTIKYSARSYSVSELTNLMQSADPESLSQLSNIATQLVHEIANLKSLENDFQDIMSSNNPLGQLDVIIENLNDLSATFSSHTGEEMPEETTPEEEEKPSLESIVEKFNNFKYKYPPEYLASELPGLDGAFIIIEEIINQAIQEYNAEAPAEALSNSDIVKTAAPEDHVKILTELIDIARDLYRLADENKPDGIATKQEILAVIHDLQSAIDKVQEEANPEEQEEAWTNINSYLVTIYNGLESLKDTLPKTDLTTINNGSQRYTQDIIDEVDEYQGAAQAIRDIKEVKIPGRSNTFAGMERDRILDTLQGHVLEIASELPRTVEWGTEGSLESTWDALARGIDKLSNELRTADATEYELTPAEFLKASSILEDFLTNEGNTLQEITQQRTSMEPVFTNLNSMIQAVHNLAQTEVDPHNLNRSNKDFGTMIGNLNNAGTQMQDAYNKLLALEKTYKGAVTQLQNMRTQRNVGASEKTKIVQSQGLGRQLNDFWRGLTGKTIGEKDVNNLITTQITPLVEGFNAYEQSLHQEVENIYKQILEITNQDSNHSLSLLAYNLFPTNSYSNMPQQTVETETTTTVDPRKGPSSKTTTKTTDTSDLSSLRNVLERFPKDMTVEDILKELR